jgi:hypothetical protein
MIIYINIDFYDPNILHTYISSPYPFSNNIASHFQHIIILHINRKRK